MKENKKNNFNLRNPIFPNRILNHSQRMLFNICQFDTKCADLNTKSLSCNPVPNSYSNVRNSKI